MNKIILLLVLFITMSFSKTNTLKESDDFVYKVKMYPAFAVKGEVEITKKGKSGKIKLLALKDENFPKTLDRSVTLNESDIQYFTEFLGNISLSNLKDLDNKGHDGITFINTFSQNGNSNEFRFWSPEKNSDYYIIADVVIGLLKRKFHREYEKVYFAQLEHCYKR